VGDVENENSVPATTSRDKEVKQTAKKQEPKKNVTNLPGPHHDRPEAKRRKTTKPSAGLDTTKMPKRTPAERKSNSKPLDTPRQDQGTHIFTYDCQYKEEGSKANKGKRQNVKESVMAEATPRRSRRKVADTSEIGPAPVLVRGVNKYGFTIWVPSTESTNLIASRSAEKASATPRSDWEAGNTHNVHVDRDQDTSIAQQGDKTAEDAIPNGYIRCGKDEEALEDDVQRELATIEDVMSPSSMIGHSKTYGEPKPAEKDTHTQDAGDQEKKSNINGDVEMKDVDEDTNNDTTQLLNLENVKSQIVRHDPQGLIQEDEVIAAEVDSSLIADVSAKRPLPGSLYWRAADRLTVTGVHFFNMTVEDLREMTRLQAFEQAQKRHLQSSSDLRALIVSATTSSQTIPEEYALADARVKLQAGRIALYGVQLRERMAMLRMFSARATQQPRELIDQLELVANEARVELAAAQRALDEDIQDVNIAKQALKSVTGVPVSEPRDLAMEAEALRRNNMINEINTAIAGYEAQAEARGGNDVAS
jgi:predicted DNA binding CopG/RHH family protein